MVGAGPSYTGLEGPGCSRTADGVHTTLEHFELKFCIQAKIGRGQITGKPVNTELKFPKLLC